MTTNPDTLRKWTGAAIVATAIVVMPAVALAAGDDVNHVITTAIWQLINLVIFVGAIVYFARKAIKKLLKERRDRLMADLNEAKRLREEAQAMFDTYQAKVDAFDDERKSILDEYRAMGEVESKRLIADAEEQAAKITRDAELSVAREVAKAKAELEAEVLELATRLAEDTLRQRVDAAKQRTLVEHYIKDLDKSQSEGAA